MTTSIRQPITCPRQPTLGPPNRPIPIQLFLYKTATCLTQPANTFFVLQMKKTCLKQQLQIFTQEMKKMHLK